MAYPWDAAPIGADAVGPKPPRGLAERIVLRPVTGVKPFPNNPRKNPDQQIARLMKSIKRVWTNPILIDENCAIIAGHGRLEAAKRLGLKTVPTLMITGLSEAEKRALVIADNRWPEQAVWDFELLEDHFRKLIEVDFDVELTGFSTGEIDLMFDGAAATGASDAGDDLQELANAGPTVTRQGDLWELGRHRVFCGDALQQQSYEVLLDGAAAEMLVADPPYNVPIQGHAVGRGRVRHREFAMASGEMSEATFTAFLQGFISQVIAFGKDGSIHYIFMDWRHLPELLAAARPLYQGWLNLLVWNKSNGGQGSFYRSKHELIGVFKNGAGRHINNFGLGAHGRFRTNVLDYPGVNGLHPARRGDHELHPTVKPIALIADLIRDCSRRNGIILDPFGGSGTTALAAERCGRIARLIELDPACVDVSIRRWQRVTGILPRLAGSGLTFVEAAADRGVEFPEDRAGSPRGSRRNED